MTVQQPATYVPLRKPGGSPLNEEPTSERDEMKVEQAKQVVAGVLEQLAIARERGQSETLKAYLAAMGRFHRYSLQNVMLIAAEEFSVLVHEVAHELLHKREERTELSRTIRETEAEAVAYAVCQAVGLESGTASRDYIQLYSGDAKALAASLERIRSAAVSIIRPLLSAEQQTPALIAAIK
jgi:Mg2+ and Co2+ transporter CorA